MRPKAGVWLETADERRLGFPYGDLSRKGTYKDVCEPLKCFGGG